MTMTQEGFCQLVKDHPEAAAVMLLFGERSNPLYLCDGGAHIDSPGQYEATPEMLELLERHRSGAGELLKALRAWQEAEAEKATA